MKFLTVTKLDSQPAVLNLNHVVALFQNGTDTHIVLSNGMDLYAEGQLVEVYKRLVEAAES